MPHELQSIDTLDSLNKQIYSRIWGPEYIEIYTSHDTKAEFNYCWRGCQNSASFPLSELVDVCLEEHPITKTLFQFSQE